MDGRRILAMALVVVGVVTLGIGVAGLLFKDDTPAASQSTTASASGEPNPSASVAPSPVPTPSSSPTPTVSASPSPQPSETPEEFFSRFADALRDGTPAFLQARLHPFVMDRYAGSDCRAYLRGLNLPDYDVEVLSVGPTKVFHWVTDDIRRDIPQATTVRIRFTEDGDTFVETDTHLVARDDGVFVFLTDCGTPKAGAV